VRTFTEIADFEENQSAPACGTSAHSRQERSRWRGGRYA